MGMGSLDHRAINKTTRNKTMSGGSYDYLHVRDSDEILNYERKLSEMIDRLAGLGYAEDAAKESAELLLIMRQYSVRASVIMQRLSEVWHAVEWWDSGDSGEDDVKEALKRYRGEEPK